MLRKTCTWIATATLALTLGLMGCGGGETKQAPSAPATTETSTTETTSEAPAAPATSEAAPAASEAAPATSEAAPAATEATPVATQQISRDDAIAIALADVGLTQADVTDLDCELDDDDATVHYDVDFQSGANEYEYDIDATTGAIIFSNVEIDD